MLELFRGFITKEAELIIQELYISRIIEEIQLERLRQEKIWGEDGGRHDDSLTTEDWIRIIKERIDVKKLAQSHMEKRRQKMIEVAAIAIAMIQSYDRTIARDREVK